MFPRNSFARRRIAHYLSHRYTRVPVIDALDAGPPISASTTDAFARPDSTTGLGALATGEDWLDQSDSVWGIASQQARVASTIVGRASMVFVESGIAGHYTLQARIRPGTAASAGLLIHADPDSSSYVYAAFESVGGSPTGVLMLAQLAGGVRTQLNSVAITWTPGDTLGVEVDEYTVVVLHNGVERMAPTLVTALAASGFQGLYVGPGGDPLSARFDDFSVVATPDPLVAAGVDQYNTPVMTYGPPVSNQPCLYEAGGNRTSTRMVRTDHGTQLTDRPTFHVAWSDPLKPGDEIRNVRDAEGHVYVRRAVAEEPGDIAPGGARVYQSWLLREVTTPNEPE